MTQYIELPISAVDDRDANFIIGLDLDNISYRFQLRFNSYDNYWRMSIYDNTDTLLRSAIKVVGDYPLLETWPEKGNLEIIMIDNDGSDEDIRTIAALGVDTTFAGVVDDG